MTDVRIYGHEITLDAAREMTDVFLWGIGSSMYYSLDDALTYSEPGDVIRAYVLRAKPSVEATVQELRELISASAREEGFFEWLACYDDEDVYAVIGECDRDDEDLNSALETLARELLVHYGHAKSGAVEHEAYVIAPEKLPLPPDGMGGWDGVDGIDYSSPEPPPQYRCGVCGVTGHKLWTQGARWATAEPARLWCRLCALAYVAQEAERRGEPSVRALTDDELRSDGPRDTVGGRLVPAIPTGVGKGLCQYQYRPLRERLWWLGLRGSETGDENDQYEPLETVSRLLIRAVTSESIAPLGVEQAWEPGANAVRHADVRMILDAGARYHGPELWEKVSAKIWTAWAHRALGGDLIQAVTNLYQVRRGLPDATHYAHLTVLIQIAVRAMQPEARAYVRQALEDAYRRR